MIALWNAFPPVADLLAAASSYRYLVVCLTQSQLPPLILSAQPSAAERAFAQAWQQQTACVQFRAVNVLKHLFPHAELWLIPPHEVGHLADYFDPQTMVWQTEPVPQTPRPAPKPWFIQPSSSPPEHVVIIGAGIAGAATAYALATRGVRVSVLEAATAAHAASGNRQGLLYAKISPYPTAQTELLLGAYGYTHRLLHHLLPQSEAWQACGVLHLNHNAAESKRNAALAQQHEHHKLYYGINAAQASEKAGIPIAQDGLFWQHGAWIHPPAFVRALLAHPHITLYEQQPLLHAQYHGEHWQLTTPQQQLTASHIVYCTGANSPQLTALQALPWQLIRGQTSLAPANSFSQQLNIALSGASYISPAWQGIHCYGASFVPQNSDSEWRQADEQHNQNELAQLHPNLAASFAPSSHPLRGHAAVRCDSPDHLPIVGRLGDIAAMQQVYAKLALDKNYRLNHACPYLPHVWINSAHGSRGLSTAAWCAESVAADILGLPNPLSRSLREALHPNRYVIRSIVRG